VCGAAGAGRSGAGCGVGGGLSACSRIRYITHPSGVRAGIVFAHVLIKLLYLSDAREVGAHIELIPFVMTIYAFNAFIGS
jgi:hypothetical protein